MGSSVVFHREEGGIDCPCLTREGFRDPAWHDLNPAEPVCNEKGKIEVAVVSLVVRASIQPATIGQRGRAAERVNQLLGTLERDDHFGIFPVSWAGVALDFREWSEAGEDFILYDDRRYIVVGADKVPDVDGDPEHHWEVGLRLVKTARPD
jgi:hypothetical protein